MRLILARLLWSFDMQPLPSPSSPTDATGIGIQDFVSQRTHLFWEKRPLRVRLRVREVR